MADESSRFNFFGLGPRPRKMIMDKLRIKELYMLATMSRQWYREVEARRYNCKSISYDLVGSTWFINVSGSTPLDLECVISCWSNGSETDFASETLYEPVAHPFSVQSQLDQLSLVSNRLMDLFTFQVTKMILEPHPELEEIVNGLLRFDHRITEDIVEIRSDIVALSRNHLSTILRLFSGKEIHIGLVEDGPEEDLPVNFERIYVTCTQWMTPNMLLENNAKEIHIRHFSAECEDRSILRSRAHIQHYSDDREDKSVLRSRALIKKWCEGEHSNLEHYSIYLYLRLLWQSPNHRTYYLNALLNTFPRIPRPDNAPNYTPGLSDLIRPPYDYVPGGREDSVFLQRRDGKRAHVFIKINCRSNMLELVFRPW